LPVFEWLETSALAIWVGESLWGYPIMLGLHAVGLAIVVGIFVMLDLRMLRVIRGISFDAFLSLFRLAWIGLIINALSGTALFTSQATTFVPGRRLRYPHPAPAGSPSSRLGRVRFEYRVVGVRFRGIVAGLLDWRDLRRPAHCIPVG
jgi:hypothetical protein